MTTTSSFEPDPSPESGDLTSGSSMDRASGARGRRRGLLAGGGVLALALVGGGAWAAMSFLVTGTQPSVALPDDTLAYASIDLDPSGSQKIAAVRTLNKFPAFADSVGVNPDGDLRRALFDRALASSDCDIDYDTDVAPWLGDRAAAAMVPGDGDAEPEPVIVVQVSDAGAAEDGLAALDSCGSGGGSDSEGGFAVDGDWAVLASSDDVARGVQAAAAESPLSDDDDFGRWTAAAGDPGIVTLYAAPGAGAALADRIEALATPLLLRGAQDGLLGRSGGGSGGGSGDGSGTGPGRSLTDGLPDPAAVRGQLADFGGFAATMRFDDGTLVLQGASATPENTAAVAGDGDIAAGVGSLPADTAAVVGLSLADGWFDQAVGPLLGGVGGGDSQGLLTQIEAFTGLALPEDVEALTDGGVVLAVGPGLDPEAVVNSTDRSTLPVALTLRGDTARIQDVVGKLSQLAGFIPGGPGLLGTSAAGDTVAVGPDAAYRDQVLGNDGLGASDTFTGVVDDASSSALFYLDADAFDDALSSVVGGDEQLMSNLTPVRAVGASTSQSGGVSRFTVKVSTD